MIFEAACYVSTREMEIWVRIKKEGCVCPNNEKNHPAAALFVLIKSAAQLVVSMALIDTKANGNRLAFDEITLNIMRGIKKTRTQNNTF
jgi:hypothetical protein